MSRATRWTSVAARATIRPTTPQDTNFFMSALSNRHALGTGWHDAPAPRHPEPISAEATNLQPGHQRGHDHPDSGPDPKADRPTSTIRQPIPGPTIRRRKHRRHSRRNTPRSAMPAVSIKNGHITGSLATTARGTCAPIFAGLKLDFSLKETAQFNGADIQDLFADLETDTVSGGREHYCRIPGQCTPDITSAVAGPGNSIFRRQDFIFGLAERRDILARARSKRLQRSQTYFPTSMLRRVSNTGQLRGRRSWSGVTGCRARDPLRILLADLPQDGGPGA